MRGKSEFLLELGELERNHEGISENGMVGGPGGRSRSRLPMLSNLVTIHIMLMAKRRESKYMEFIVLLFSLSGREIEGRERVSNFNAVTTIWNHGSLGRSSHS